MGSDSMILGILERPDVWEVLLDVIMKVAVPLWIAVMMGILVGWSWRPRWANFTWTLNIIPKFDFIPFFGSFDSINELEQQTASKPSSSPNKVSSVKEAEIKQLIEVEESSSNKVYCVDEADLRHLRQLVEVKDGGPAWIPMMDRSTSTMSYKSWRRDSLNGPPQYRSRTLFEDATPEIVRDFFWDDEFRFKWDDLLLEHNTLEECSTTGIMIVHWVRKFPFFSSNREYVIGRRIWESDRSYYCVSKCVPYSSVPRRSKPRRVDLYYSSWCIHPAESRRDGQMTACEVIIFHHEDVGIPYDIVKLGVRQGMWGFVKKIDPGLRAYQKERLSGVPLSHYAMLAQINTKTRIIMAFDVPRVSIIAMKGPPFTRKTEFATSVASSLGCPLLSLDHLLDVLQPSYFQDSETSKPLPQDLAFEIICHTAQYNLWMGLSKNVVIDSPLSSASHLHRLTKLASSLSPLGARLLIIECKPKNVYLWQMKFEKHFKDYPDFASKWYKPKNWEDVEKVIKDGDYDERLIHDHKQISKLVVDPLLDQPRLYSRPVNDQRFIEAVKYMIARDEGDGHAVVLYNEWKRSRNLSSTTTQNDESLKKWLYCKDGQHNISNHTTEEGLEYETNCIACGNKISGRESSSYTCNDCRLAFHKECVESYDDNINYDTRENPFPKDLFRPSYKFPNEFSCAPCEQDGNGFSDNCTSCLFETHLRCRLMPTVIKHVDTEEHLLSIVLSPVSDFEVYRCAACGCSDEFGLYMCQICGISYHYKCLTLPRRLKHEHGGHHHCMKLSFSSKPAEDYICNECVELRDPELWFYSCEDCHYEVDLYCVHQTSSLISVA